MSLTDGKPKNAMDADKRRFIEENYKRMSSRQIARKIGLSRSEVEKIIRESGKAGASERVCGSAFFSLSRKTEIGLLLAVLAAGFLLRLLYVYALRKSPFFEPLTLALRSPLDDALYHTMAQEMARGNWAGQFALGLYRMPAYPYFLALIYRVFGPNISVVHILQACMGSLVPLFCYALSKKLFKGALPALFSACIAAVYIPLIFFGQLLVGENLSILLNLAAIYLLISLMAGEIKPDLRYLISGLLLGFSVLLRPNTLLPVFLVAVFMLYVFSKRSPARQALAVVILFGAGCLSAILPLTVRNMLVYKDFVPLNAIGGVNLYIGNGPYANGRFNSPESLGTNLDQIIENSKRIAEKETGRPLKDSEVSAFWTATTLRYVLGRPLRSSALMVKKSLLFLNQYELPDILNLYFVKRFVPVLRPGALTFGVLLIFSLFGLFETLKFRGPEKAALKLVVLFLAGYALSVILFFVTSRYRLPAIPFMIVFAGLGMDRLLRCLKAGDYGAIKKFIMLAAVSLAVAVWPIEKANLATDYNNLGIAVKYKGNLADAEKYYRKAMSISPSYPAPYFNLAQILQSSGRSAEAAELLQKFESLKKAPAPISLN